MNHLSDTEMTMIKWKSLLDYLEEEKHNKQIMRKDIIMYLNIQINEQKEIARSIKLNNRIIKQNRII